MGAMPLLPMVLAALGFFLFTALWYGVLLGRTWQRAARLSDTDVAGANLPLILALVFAFELLIALVLAHQFAMTGPSDRAIMMMAVGFGAAVMTPAIGIVYLLQRRSGLLFAIDAAHVTIGMAIMGAIFVAWR